jgi:cobalt-zinc-cadmium efflux system outer membrane protein
MGAASLIRIGVVAGVLATTPSLLRAQTTATQQTPAGPTLTLTDALQRAVDKNSAIAAARLGRQVKVAGVGVASERLNPEISFELSRETPKQAISGVMPIELGGKRSARINLANASVSTAEAELTRLIASVRADVRRAYFASVAANRRLTIAEELRGLATRTRDAAQARLKAGDVAEIDVVQAELALADVDNDVSAARGEVTATRAALNALIGEQPDAVIALNDDFGTIELPSAADALALALGSNAELAVLDRQIAEQQMRLALAKTAKTPDASVGSSLTYNAQPEFNIGYRLNFGVTLPLFTQHKAGVQLEDFELTRLEAERTAARIRIGADVVGAVAHASAAREQLERFQNESLPRVQTLERMAQDSYNAGETTLTELLQALQQARNVRQRGLQAGLDFQSAMADLERAIGVIRR